MIEHLRLKSDEMPDGVELCDLGQINILCGRNSSGKSTILRSINSHNTMEVGVRISKEFIDEELSRYQESYHGQRRLDLSKLSEYLLEIAGHRAIWYAVDEPTFRKMVLEKGASHQVLQTIVDPGKFIADVLKRETASSQCKSELIPDKRRLLPYKDIAAGEGINPAGEGILNRLFWMAVQCEGDPGRTMFEDIAKSFSVVTRGFRPHISLLKDNRLFLHYRYKGETPVPADKCGMGFSDLLIILYYLHSPEYNLVLIEEAENHLHPDTQRRLLQQIRKRPDKQVVISTHSNVFLNSNLVDSIFLTRYTDRIVVHPETKRAEIMRELGYSVAENLVSDLLVLVEGSWDIAVLEQFMNTLGGYTEYEIKMLPLGGDNMEYVDPTVFENQVVLALVDRDGKSARQRKIFMDRCMEVGIDCRQTERYAMENYYPERVLRLIFKGQIPEDFTMNPDIKLENQLQNKLSVKNNSRKLAKAMNIEEIKTTGDIYDFLLAIMKQCKQVAALTNPKEAEA